MTSSSRPTVNASPLAVSSAFATLICRDTYLDALSAATSPTSLAGGASSSVSAPPGPVRCLLFSVVTVIRLYELDKRPELSLCAHVVRQRLPGRSACDLRELVEEATLLGEGSRGWLGHDTRRGVKYPELFNEGDDPGQRTAAT